MKHVYKLPAKETVKSVPATEKVTIPDLSDFPYSTDDGFPQDMPRGDDTNFLAATYPINTTNLKRDFEEQARKIKEVIILGETPQRIEKPKVTFSLNKEGFLTGDIDSVKETGDTYTVDLVEKAAAVNEGVKRPVFKRKTTSVPKQQEPSLAPTEPIKDELDSEDKQPKEAVACESRFPTFNKREKALISANDPAAVRSEMASGKLSKVRGAQILYTMGAEEAFDVISSDAGTVVVTDAEEFTPKKSRSYPHGTTLEGIIDTEIGDDMNCEVKYSYKAPLQGRVTKLTEDRAIQVKEALESYGVSARIIASATEEFTVLFNEIDNSPSTRWKAFIRDANEPVRIMQIVLNTSEDATKEDVIEYLEETYGEDSIMSVEACIEED